MPRIAPNARRSVCGVSIRRCSIFSDAVSMAMEPCMSSMRRCEPRSTAANSSMLRSMCCRARFSIAPMVHCKESKSVWTGMNFALPLRGFTLSQTTSLADESVKLRTWISQSKGRAAGVVEGFTMCSTFHELSARVRNTRISGASTAMLRTTM